MPYLKEKLTQAGLEIHEDGVFSIIDNPQHAFRKQNPFDNYKSIVFMESYGNDIHVHQLHKDKTLVIQEKLYELENLYTDKGFIRVNKSQIVNIRFINDIDPWVGQKYILTMKNGISIDVNRTYYKKFKEYLKL